MVLWSPLGIADVLAAFVGKCKAIYPYMAANVSMWKDTVAHLDVVI